MPLPDQSAQPWPPDTWAPIARDIDEADAWYQGDVTKLAAFYGGISNPQSHSPIQRFFARLGSRTTRQQEQAPTRGAVHIPAASDIAATSADLLFGEPVTWSTPTDDGTAAVDRLTELAELGRWDATLLEGAEVCAGLGGIYLRPTWDEQLAAHPLLTVVHPDKAYPEFRHGILRAVTFWRILASERGVVWRHLERYEPGLILHGLYRGTDKELGTRYPLTDQAATAALPAEIDLTEMGIKGMLAVYVPNVRPNRKHRGEPVGRSDTAGSESLMDALDETWSSWMRDIRLGKARLVVPDEFLDRAGRGAGATFDTDREVFSPLNMAPENREHAGITPVQFEIRTEDHARTAMDLFERIVLAAGYSPQSFGLQGDGGQQTATEVSARQDRSARTTARKRGYWTDALAQVAESMLAIDRAVFSGPAESLRPDVEWPDVGEDSMQDTATTLNLLSMARAVSTDTKIRMLHPDWDEPEVAAEVARIQAEDGTVVDDPTGGLP